MGKAGGLLLSVLFVFLFSPAIFAESFVMEGAFVKAGVSSSGTLGYGLTSSPGIQHDPSGSGNFGIDDYLIPGSPWEMFSVLTDQAGLQVNNNNYYATEGIPTVETNSFTNLSGGAYDNHVIWSGHYGAYYDMRHEYFYGRNEERINVVTTITARQDLTGVRFARAIDPDPDVLTYGSFTTRNGRGYDHNRDGDFDDAGDILPQNWVHSVGTQTGLTLGLFSNATYPHNTGISAPWSQRPTYYLAGLNDGDGDHTIGLAFDFGVLKAGESVTFNYAYVMGDIVADADIPWVPGVVYEPAKPPAYPELPPEVKESHKLVVITHGWNSDGSSFSDQMKEDIEAKIKAAQAAGTLDPSERWAVLSYDWGEDSGGTPARAWVQAAGQGRFLGDFLKKTYFEYIHFIAHSAGSQLIQSAMDTIAEGNSSPPVMHATFLDAYHPGPLSWARYGVNANWAEQYVDTRKLIADWPDTTDTLFPMVHNFDVTSLDPDGLDDPLVARHAWPYQYYQKTVARDFDFDSGYSLAYEDGKFCNVAAWLEAVRALYPIHQVTVPKRIDRECIDWGAALFKASSSTGTVYFPAPGTLGLKTGSPVWSSMQVPLNESADLLVIDYQFLSAARGVLKIYLDDRLVFEIDEQFATHGANTEAVIPLGAVASGTHTLSFRLDPFSELQSVVEISNARFALAVESVPEESDDDNDGYTELQGDCNDRDAAIHPAANELCDGIDNNCNAKSDESGYLFGGFSTPVNAAGDSLFKAGQTIPVKLSLASCSGAPVPEALVSLGLHRVSEALSGDVEELAAESSGNSNSGTLFRYDPSGDQFIYNLNTKPLAGGSYELSVRAPGLETLSLRFSLKK